MWLWRKMENISWKDHISNETVFSQRVGEKRQLIKTIRERQAIWIGHVLRGDTLIKDISEGRIKGRSRCRTLDWMKKKEKRMATLIRV